MMDISSHSSDRRLPVPPQAIPVMVIGGPISFHLRIAGLYRTPEADSVEYARLRTILDYEFILQVDGRTWVSVGDEGSIDIVPGDVIFIPPRFVHGWAYRAGVHRAAHFDFFANPALRPYENLRPTSVIIQKPSVATSMPIFHVGGTDDAGGLRLPFVTPVRSPAQWAERMSTLASLYAQPSTLSIADQAAVNEILGWMLRTLASDAGHAGITSTGGGETRLQQLVRELDGSEETASLTQLSVAELATRAGLGETAFRAAFYRLTGRSPRDYIEERRISRAKHLLVETDRSVKAVALSEGYDDAYHFSRVFKRVTGVSPSDFRRMALGE
ncbi:MAG TPA: helix-turn-helix domain-containing protein [Capsulimonadaceae bacterium]|jgi:AraC-like DNA-binding protein